MTRPWSCSIVALGLLGTAFTVACGGDSSDTGSLGGKDAGSKDGTASGGDDSTAEGGPAGDDASSADATVDDASGDADDGGDGAIDLGDDAANVADAPSEASPAGGGDAGAEASTTPADGGHDGDGGKAAPDSDGGADAGTATATDGGACNLAGTWGAEITINVNWAAGGLLDIVIAPGSGTIKQWLLSTRTQTGTTVTDTAVVCGIDLPDFQGNAELVNETYGIRFPNSLFDNGGLTSFSISGTVSDTTPTATYTTTPAAALLGLTLANPTTAVWPATIATEIDEDGDSKPGITANVVPPGGGYQYVPLDISVISFPATVARADRLYLAIRQVTSVTAQLSDCNHASGSVTVPQITDPSTATKKYAIDSHVIGCRQVDGGTDCSAMQTTFVDENQPVFVPTATTYTAARLTSGSTCATVRGQFQ